MPPHEVYHKANQALVKKTHSNRSNDRTLSNLIILSVSWVHKMYKHNSPNKIYQVRKILSHITYTKTKNTILRLNVIHQVASSTKWQVGSSPQFPVSNPIRQSHLPMQKPYYFSMSALAGFLLSEIYGSCVIKFPEQQAAKKEVACLSRNHGFSPNGHSTNRSSITIEERSLRQHIPAVTDHGKSDFGRLVLFAFSCVYLELSNSGYSPPSGEPLFKVVCKVAAIAAIQQTMEQHLFKC